MAHQKRKLVDVSERGLRCADCRAEIQELPFEPEADPRFIGWTAHGSGAAQDGLTDQDAPLV